MGTHVESLTARPSATRAWVAVGAVVLLLAALGGGFAIGRASETTAEPIAPAEPAALGLASAEVVGRVDAGLEAWNAVDEEGIAALYADDAVFTTVDPSGTDDALTGSDEIAAWAVRFGPQDPWGLERVTEVVASGGVVTYGATFNCGGTCESAAVLLFDRDGQIWRQWVIMP